MTASVRRPRGGGGSAPSKSATERGSNLPIELSEFFLNCVLAKYSVKALLLYSLNPKFSTEKRYKLYTNFTFWFQLLVDSIYPGFASEPHWETSVPRPPGPPASTT